MNEKIRSLIVRRVAAAAPLATPRTLRVAPVRAQQPTAAVGELQRCQNCFPQLLSSTCPNLHTGSQQTPKQQDDGQQEKQQPAVVNTAAATKSNNGAAAQAEPSPSSELAVSAEKEVDSAKSDEYTETMNRKMGTSLTYRHELGIDYNRILPDLIVGSCLQVGPAGSSTPAATLLLLRGSGSEQGHLYHGDLLFALAHGCRPLQM
jgi:hypothetical protein